MSGASCRNSAKIFPEARIGDGDTLGVRHGDAISGSRGQNAKCHRDAVIATRIDRAGQLPARRVDAQPIGKLLRVRSNRAKGFKYHIVESDSGPGPATDLGRSLRHAKISAKILLGLK